MNVILCENYDDLSRNAAAMIETYVRANPTCVLGLATGGTPLGTYQKLILGHEQKGTDYSRVSAFNLDEYVGLEASHPQSYHTYMQEHLYRYINVDAIRQYIPNGKAVNMEDECERYESLLDEIGPPDIQLLGIGENGHIGFNEPGSDLDGLTHTVELAESTRQANARYFPSIEDVPKRAITMGIGSILKSKHILLLASGSRKAMAIKRLVSEEVQSTFPASVLHQHPHVTLLVDRLAYQLVEEMKDEEKERLG
ncbi:glucosamine-6-phosphate deaminase [Pontibacillus halophilus JSM 076056 = DSM 19796]|uniref:Glucosamine-6-phosphate deaminase n=1 Tax=Pontibacillus halophilus JSM 076056 = DSM 19796 TaxID=1385510 RepID=A0A0A5I8Z4_9BACI|nr:glucosamine-6-phosphate deaminase [Pontibacillus halophilus]KGX92312.1 glucosamine-6-phosphate deaminase [Pontibacillus halophilus JSM 076056 = DSM 19796]